MKTKPSQEIIIDDGKEILFDSNFGTLEAIQNNPSNKDLSTLFNEISNGAINVIDLKHIIKCGLVSVNEEKIKDKNELAESLILRYGLQEMQQMCYLILSHCMIGEKKSSKITYEQRTQAMTESFIDLKSQSLKKALSLWAIMLVSSTTLACLITSYILKLIA